MERTTFEKSWAHMISKNLIIPIYHECCKMMWCKIIFEAAGEVKWFQKHLPLTCIVISSLWSYEYFFFKDWSLSSFWRKMGTYDSSSLFWKLVLQNNADEKQWFLCCFEEVLFSCLLSFLFILYTRTYFCASTYAFTKLITILIIGVLLWIHLQSWATNFGLLLQQAFSIVLHALLFCSVLSPNSVRLIPLDVTCMYFCSAV